MRIGKKKSTLLVAASAFTLGLTLTAAAFPAQQARASSVAAPGAWTHVQTDSHAGSDRINRIAATPTGNVWAVGTLNGQSRSLVERLTPSGFTRVDLPADWHELNLTQVNANSDSNVWATGNPYSRGDDSNDSGGDYAIRWNGTSWSAHRFGDDFYTTGIAATGTQGLWVVGNVGNDPASQYVKRWTGSGWTNHPLPILARAISARSDQDIWVVGGAGGQPAIRHWNGSAWSTSPVPTVPTSPGGEMTTSLNDVYAASANDVWAVGQLYSTDADGRASIKSLLTHWDGQRWSVTIGAKYSNYDRVVSDGDGGVWIKNGAATLRHRSRDGVWTDSRVPVPAGQTWLSAADFVHQPGTRTVWMGGFVYGTESNSAYWRNP